MMCIGSLLCSKIKIVRIIADAAYQSGDTTMTRQERHDEVVRLAANLGLTAERIDNNSWHVQGPDGCYRGLLVYNQRSGVWKMLGRDGKAYFGELDELLNLLARADQ